MSSAVSELVERRIEEARIAGAFDGLPGEGRPLDLDEERLVPEDLRVAMRILKNAGVVPIEVESGRLMTRLPPGLQRFAAFARTRDSTALDGARDDGNAAVHALPTHGHAAGEAQRSASRMQALVRVLDARGLSLLTGVGREYRDKLLGKVR